MPRIRLIHWNAAEARERAERLRKAGYTVVAGVPKGPEDLKILRRSPPDAVVIDLDRMPMQGRDYGIAIRHAKSTRELPLVFVGGEGEKLEKIRRVLPDAEFTTWGRIRSALKRALAAPRGNVVTPISVFAGYSGTPLPKKLGIKEGSVVGLLGAPEDFATTLGELPAGAELRGAIRGRCDIVLWFARSRAEVERRVAAMGARKDGARVWIAWPKKASGMETDLTQNDVRRLGLANGLVDYKICAIDATWSGLLFAQRKS